MKAMSISARLTGLCFGFAAMIFIAPRLPAADLVPLTDNEKPPFLAIWKEPKYQPDAITQCNAWLNRKAVWADISPCFFFAPPKTWAELELPFDKMWGKWVTDVPGRRVVLGLITLPPDGSTLEAGATGAYDAHFNGLAFNLVANHLGDAIICLGPGNPYGGPHPVSNKADAANFVLYYQHIVKAMRSVPGAAKLQFDWVWSDREPEASYPGDDVVDFIGIVMGEGCGDKTIYPYPPFASPSERTYRQKLAWDKIEYPALQTVSAFAKAHGKPFSIPIWHLSADHSRSEGFDAPYFIESMFKYIQDPANNVYFASYFEYYHYSWLSDTMGYKTNEPQSAALFQKLFSLPGAAPKTGKD